MYRPLSTIAALRAQAPVTRRVVQLITEPAMITEPAATMITDIEGPGDPERLIVTPEADPQKAGKFTGRLAGRGEVIVTNSAQPLFDGARGLIARGFAAGLLLTLRHVGKGYDSFIPQPIGEWAKWTYKERDKRGLSVERWMPFAVPRSGQGTISAAPAAVRAARTEFAPAAHRCSATAGSPAGAPPPRSISSTPGPLGSHGRQP